MDRATPSTAVSYRLVPYLQWYLSIKVISKVVFSACGMVYLIQQPKSTLFQIGKPLGCPE